MAGLGRRQLPTGGFDIDLGDEEGNSAKAVASLSGLLSFSNAAARLSGAIKLLATGVGRPRLLMVVMKFGMT